MVGMVEYQPAAFLVPLTVAVMVGAVLSTLTAVVTVAVLPALSIAVPCTSWPAPSFETVIGAGQDAMPDSASVHVNVTVASLLYQAAALGMGATVAVMVGVVRSRLTMTVAAAVLPALSTAVPRAT